MSPLFQSPEELFEVPVLRAERYAELVPPLLTSLQQFEDLAILLQAQQQLHSGLVKLDESKAKDTKLLLDNMARTAESLINIGADLKEAENAIQDATSTRAGLQVRDAELLKQASMVLTLARTNPRISATQCRPSVLSLMRGRAEL